VATIMWAKRKQTGFTIVELLIVIVVIAILASITVVAFNGVQARAQDSHMRSAMNQLEKAILRWHVSSGERPRGGWSSTVGVSGNNCVDGSGGWVFSGAYPCALEDILLTQQLIPSGFTHSLPPNKEYNSANHGRYSVMFYPCGSTGRYALYYHLRSPSAEDTASITAAEAASCPTAPRATYMMRAAKILSFS